MTSPTPNLTQLLSPQEVEEHRGRIGVEVEIVLDGYWQARPGPQMKAAILADWMDELEDWYLDQVRWALRSWRKRYPDKKPNPGHIAKMLKEKRGRTFVAERDGMSFDKMFSINRPAGTERKAICG